MVIGRIKILLIAFLILGLCLLFFKNNKEDFASATPPAWGAGVGYQTGTLGTFRGNGGALGPQTFSIDQSGVLTIGNIDNNGNDINSALLTTITNLKSRLSSNRVTLTISYLNTYSYVSLESVDLTLYNNLGSLDSSGYRLNTSFLDENDPITQGMPSGIIDITGAEITIYWRSGPNCAITPWSSYDTCTATGTATCEATATSKSGTVTNTRILMPPFGTTDTSTCGDMLTYALTQTTPCSLGICPPTNCVPGQWTDSGTCTATGTATCEPTATSQSGLQTQTRTITPAINGGTCSAADSLTSQTVPCSLGICPPTNCVPGEWTNSGTCTATGTATCEPTATSQSGLQTQTRTIVPATNGGTCSVADSLTSKTTPCSLPGCPTDCILSSWSNIGTCTATGTATCESRYNGQSGLQQQTRTFVPATNGGSCPVPNTAATTRGLPCSLPGCSTNCLPGQWDYSGACMPTATATCEPTATSQSGLKTLNRSVQAAINGGTCSAEDSATTKTVPCSLPGCPTNCVPSTWINSGSCTANTIGAQCEISATSLSGKQLQTRIITPATNGGTCADSATTQTINCALSRCPIDCVPGTWTNSGTCVPRSGGPTCETSLTSKSGKQTQLRSIVPSQFGGSCTDSNTSQTIDCALSTRCPVPCQLSAWTNVGTCQNSSNVVCEPTTTSMSGLQRQFQTIEKPAEFGGACPIVSPNTSNVQTMPCRLSNSATCTNPFANTVLTNLTTIDYKDFPIFGSFPKNNVRFTQCNVGDTIATVFENMENFNRMADI